MLVAGGTGDQPHYYAEIVEYVDNLMGKLRNEKLKKMQDKAGK